MKDSYVSKIILSMFSVIMIASLVVGSLSTGVSAATPLYGRAEYRGYFKGEGGSYDYCPDVKPRVARLICGGVNVDNTEDFIQYYWNHLYSSDARSQRAAAFTILVMEGVDGPQAGGSVVAGVEKAKGMFGGWSEKVRAYGSAGLINFNQQFTYTTNTASRNNDVIWYNNIDSDFSIVFNLANGGYVAIKKACANMVGETSYLPPAPDPQPIGNFDVANCSTAQGWVFDRSRSSQAILAHIQVDGVTRTGENTNIVRTDVNADYGITGTHGFNYGISNWVNDGSAHKVEVFTYNIDSNGTQTGGPISFGVKNIAAGACVEWKLAGTTSIASNYNNSKVGEEIGFTHNVTNGGPTNTNKDISYSTRIFRSDVNVTSTTTDRDPHIGLNGIFSGTAGSGVIKNGTIASIDGNDTSKNQTRYRITANDVNKFVCSYIKASQKAHNDTGAFYSNVTCKYIPYSYTLTPSVEIGRSTVETGMEFDVNPVVKNSGPTKTEGTKWKLSYVTYPASVGLDKIPSTVVNGAGAATANPCTYYNSTGANECKSAALISRPSTGHNNTDNEGTFAFPTPEHRFTKRLVVAQDLPVGTKVCYALSVHTRTYQTPSSQNPWAHSAPTCIVVAKRPVAQIIGGDLIVGRSTVASSTNPGNIGTSVKVIGATQYGSWAEYGIIASGSVSGMGSAAGYAGGSASTKSLCDMSLLTFSNRPSGGTTCSKESVGGYAVSGANKAEAIAARFPVSTATEILSSGASPNHLGIFPDTPSGVYTTKNSNKSVQIGLSVANQPSIGKGKWYVIHAPLHTVRITSDINYTSDTLSSLADIPQVIIIARSINIAPNVKNVDAWLVAIPSNDGAGNFGGYVNTCDLIAANNPSGGANKLTSANCNNPLRINGPVVASRLFLYRTAGAGDGAASGDPAEVFNLRPDAYLWGTAMQEGTIRARTTVTTELPPRY